MYLCPSSAHNASNWILVYLTGVVLVQGSTWVKVGYGKISMHLVHQHWGCAGGWEMKPWDFTWLKYIVQNLCVSTLDQFSLISWLNINMVNFIYLAFCRDVIHSTMYQLSSQLLWSNLFLHTYYQHLMFLCYIFKCANDKIFICQQNATVIHPSVKTIAYIQLFWMYIFVQYPLI